MMISSHSPTRNRITGLVVAAFIFALDQLIKYVVIGPLALESRGEQGIGLIPFFKLTYAENRGVSMGFLTANNDTQRWLLVALTVVVAILVAVWLWREKARWDTAALGLILGGALGNILDRARLGFVVDYADLQIGSWRPFSIFNLADAAISIGVVILVARAFLLRDKTEAASEA